MCDMISMYTHIYIVCLFMCVSHIDWFFCQRIPFRCFRGDFAHIERCFNKGENPPRLGDFLLYRNISSTLW